MDKIESIQNKKVKEWKKLKEKKYRDREGKFLVEGPHLVEEAYRKGLVLEIISLEEVSYDGPSFLVSSEVMKLLSDQQTIPSLIAVVKKLQETEIIGNVFVLDGIQDPGNLGTILRSAVAFQVPNILLSHQCVDLYNAKVIRSTEGMFFSLNIVRESCSEMLKSLKEKGYHIYGCDMDHGEVFEAKKIETPYAFVIGSEGQGLSKESKEFCEKFCYLPMSNEAESLNAAVCASIIMYEMSR